MLEPSTWAGLSGLVLFGKLLAPVEYHGLIDWAAGAASGLAVVLKERA